MQAMSPDYTLTTNPINGVQSWVFTGLAGPRSVRLGLLSREDGARKASEVLSERYFADEAKPRPHYEEETPRTKKDKRAKDYDALSTDAKKYAGYVWAGGVVAGVIWFVTCLLIIAGVL